MGRSYYVHESVEKYFTKLLQIKESYLTGLLIGQCSAQRDYVVLAVQTPQKEDQCEESEQKPALSKLDEIDEEWVSIHASQVSRMLPGGLQLIGVFLITSPDLSKESPNVLRKLIYSVEKSSMKNRLWNLDDSDVTDRATVQICSATRKVTCRTYDVKDPKSSPKPADWKYQNSSLPWLTIDCNINVDLTIPLVSSTSYQEQQKCMRKGLAQWTKEIEDGVFLFSGQVKDIDGDLFEDQKKSRSGAHSSQIISASILSPVSNVTRSTALVEACKSSLNIHGVVKCKGYIYSNKPKVKDAIQALKRDILNTVSDRCEILFEDIILNGPQHEVEMNSCSLPQRVFVPIAGSSVEICDYVFGDETAEDLQNRFLEMLDQEVHYDQLEFPEKKTATTTHVRDQQVGHDSLESDDLSSEKYSLKKEESPPQVNQNMGLVIAATVVLLAALVSFYCLSE